MDPRISARRAEVTRQQVRRRLRLAAVLGILVTVVVGGWALLHSPLFSARAITVVGAAHETAARIESAAGLSTHPSLMDLDTGAAARRIERLPWVQSASVATHWPDGVRVTVTERVPRLIMRVAPGSWAELSVDGRVLALTTNPSAGLVTVVGPTSPGPPGTTLGVADQVGLRVAATLPPSFRAQVTGVDVEPGGWVQLTMTTPILVDIGTATQLSAKFEDVSALLAGATLHTGDVIDVSVPDAPTVTGG